MKIYRLQAGIGLAGLITLLLVFVVIAFGGRFAKYLFELKVIY